MSLRVAYLWDAIEYNNRKSEMLHEPHQESIAMTKKSAWSLTSRDHYV